MKLTLISLALAALAKAQGLSALPSCSLACLTTRVQSVGCSLINVECACKQSDEADQATLLEALLDLCGSQGIAPSPSVSSVLEVAPTVQAAHAPATSVQTTATTPPIISSISMHSLHPLIPAPG